MAYRGNSRPSQEGGYLLCPARTAAEEGLADGGCQPLVNHRGRQLRREREEPLTEGARDQLQYVRCLHVSSEPAQQLDGLNRSQEEPVDKQEKVPLLPGPVYHFARKDGRVDV